MNNKGFTVIELLASFTLTMIIVVFLFEIVLELKDVYVNESIKTTIINENAVAAVAINQTLEENVLNNIECIDNVCTFSLAEGDEIKLSLTDKGLNFGSQKFVYPADTTFEDINLTNTKVNTKGGSTSIFKVSFIIKNPALSKNMNFNYVYTY